MTPTNCQICGKPIPCEPYAMPLGDDHRSFKMCGVCLVSYCDGVHRAMHSHDAAWIAKAEIRARVEQSDANRDTTNSNTNRSKQ